jgi:DNA gyrase/topoisomerase IV subunit B
MEKEKTKKEEFNKDLYIDDEMTIIETDIQKVRNRPSMYCGYDKEEGVLHICKEIIDNSRD